MADTISIANLRAKLWSKQLWVEAQKELYFEKMSGKMEPTALQAEAAAFNNIIVSKEELSKEPGDTIYIPLAMKLSGDGVTGDSDLEGSEEAITTYDYSMTINQIRNAVRLTGKMDEKKVAYDMRAKAKALLKIWLKEKMDKDMFTALSNSPTASATWASTRHLYAGDATTVATLDSSVKDTGNLFDCRIIRKAKRLAERSKPKIRPVYVKGKAYYVILAAPEQVRALHESTDWQAAYQYAAERGQDNPIFTGADSVIDGVIVHSHPNLCLAATGERLADDANIAANIAVADVARALFLGAQAGAYAIGQRPFWVEKTFDYENKQGFATGLIYKASKTIYNSIDYATIVVDTMIVTD